MLRAGLIHQEANGIFYYLPLMKKVIEKVEAIIDKNMASLGCCKLLCPILQSCDNWKASGRYDAYGPEMLRIHDRHHKELLYSPTAEEGAFNLAKYFIKSYKQLPKYIYQIHWKFRDELSPRNGLLRGREFLMKDGYSFHNNVEESYDAYLDLYNRYVNIFNDLGIGHQCIAASGDSGPIGGQLNHEIILLEEEGDTTVWYQTPGLTNYNHLEDLQNNCGTVEKHLKKDNISYKEARGIELGHLFNYEDKYGKDMDAGFINQQGKKELFYGGCYGIGVTRLIGAIIQTNGDDNGIIWPPAIAPFTYHLVFTGDKLYDAMKIYNGLGHDHCLVDDRDESMGVKLKDADLLGMPYQIIVGNRWEVKIRSTGVIHTFDGAQSLLNFFIHQD